jgi:hypothetical protein
VAPKAEDFMSPEQGVAFMDRWSASINAHALPS